ncbi:MAG TPA: xanthine dehydrogenase family protein molybdopterin-binding subunit, partial [Paraburkholderia sp.]|nr:xanthine dehydrogenase family protein molybdopterin-binding subunit [Paraburkholderia sp.]
MNQRETNLAEADAPRNAESAALVDETSEPRASKHVGRSMQRLEDPAILTGRGRYGDDIGVKPGTLHAAVLRSPHAHAELVSIDASSASKLRGVRAVLTRDDLRPWSRPFVVGVKSPMEQWALAM